jgi:signal transduction histidine kinase
MPTGGDMLPTMLGVRPGRLDVAFAVLLTAAGVALMAANVADPEVQAPPLAAPAFVLVTLPLLWRSAAPLAALAAAALAIGAHVALFGSVVRCGIVFPLEFILVFAAGARLPRREALVGLALGLTGVTVMTLDDIQVGPDVLPFFAPLTAAVWGLGRVVHSRSALVAELESRTAELRRTRDDRARLEVATDRARLSVELDRLLQRRLDELAGLAVPTADPDAAVARFEAIEHRSRQTLDEMRAMVGVLRDDDLDAPTAPQPTLRHLESLLRGGRLDVEGSPRVLPAGVELSAYRVVEHLLAALEDADDVSVRVRFGDDALEIVVAGPLRRHGAADTALERARERVELHHGTFVTTTDHGRAQAVAQLPVALAGV